MRNNKIIAISRKAPILVRVFLVILFPIVSAFLSLSLLVAHPVYGEKIILTQPNGIKIVGYIYGDEYHHRIETEEGYTLILNEETGTIEYAKLENNKLVPSGMIAGIVPPVYLQIIDYPKHLSDRKFVIAEIRRKYPERLHELMPLKRSPEGDYKIQALEGTRQVFVVCVEFQSEESPPTEWYAGLYSPSGFDRRIFSDDPSDISMTNFYKSNSYNKFWPVGYTYPDWITLPKTASWYEENGRWSKIIEDAMDGIRNIDPTYDFTQYANNGDLDLILVWAGTRQTWGDFYWPHKSSPYLTRHGVRVKSYNAVNERGSSGLENTGISVFCHEYGHMTGCPDLYDYSEFQNKPMGYYCIMGASNTQIGFCGYLKWKNYGWVDAIQIVLSGTYYADALGLASASNPRLYKINIDSPKEYLLIENRNNGADPNYENYPYRRSGLLITHIDENYPPAVGLPSYTFYGVEAIAACLIPSITKLSEYALYRGNLVFSSDYGYARLGPSYPDNKPPGSYITLTSDDDTENVIYRNTQGHTKSTKIYIENISASSNTMNFILTSDYDLIISAGTGGTTDPPPGIYTYEGVREVSVEAVPDTYYGFEGWSGDASGRTNPITITLDTYKSIMANFMKIHPPLSFAGRKVLNRSLLQEEYINVLSWYTNPPNEYISKYRIYQVDGENRSLLVELSANTFEYWHRRVNKDKEYTYALCAVNDEGREGEPASVTVK